jgi:predicted metallo-beta-lactamase superfamily hydrolase
MKITINQLRRIIKEEVEGLLSEDDVLQEMDYAAKIKELEAKKNRTPEEEKLLKTYKDLMSPGI